MDELTITLEDGKEVSGELYMIFSAKGNEYAAVMAEEIDEAYLCRYDESDDGITLTDIEDDDEMVAVNEVFLELMEEEGGVNMSEDLELMDLKDVRLTQKEENDTIEETDDGQ